MPSQRTHQQMSHAINPGGASVPPLVRFYPTGLLLFQIFLLGHLQYGILAPAMIARVTLEIALRKEFDYSIPPEFASQIDVGSRVKVPFGPRQVLGVVTSLLEESTHTNLRPVLKVIGQQSQVTPRVLQLARWIAEYYCCPVEIALKGVLPEAVRKEEARWRQRLFVSVV